MFGQQEKIVKKNEMQDAVNALYGAYNNMYEVTPEEFIDLINTGEFQVEGPPVEVEPVPEVHEPSREENAQKLEEQAKQSNEENKAVLREAARVLSDENVPRNKVVAEVDLILERLSTE